MTTGPKRNFMEISRFARRWLRECNASEVGAEELQKNRGVHDRAEFGSHSRIRGCGESLTRSWLPPKSSASANSATLAKRLHSNSLRQVFAAVKCRFFLSVQQERKDRCRLIGCHIRSIGLRVTSSASASDTFLTLASSVPSIQCLDCASSRRVLILTHSWEKIIIRPQPSVFQHLDILTTSFVHLPCHVR